MTLRRALRKQALPQVGSETIREVLHEAGYSYQRTRTWVQHRLRAAQAQERHGDDL